MQHSNTKTVFEISNCSWVSSAPETNKKYTAQIRYHGEFLQCEIVNIKEDIATFEFKNPVLVAKGQSIVLYDKGICLGGGIV